jgi:hypothetical protein
METHAKIWVRSNGRIKTLKRPTGTRVKTWARSNGRIKSYGHFDSLLKFGWPDLLVTELRFHSDPKANGLRKLVQNFERDPTVGSKVMAILTRYSFLTDQTSLLPSNDLIETPRKTASTNSCKNLRAIQRSDQKLCPLLKSGRIDLLVTE